MFKTAECVTPKHPDKLCDRMSDIILDACLEEDGFSKVAVETMGGHGIITITGEITTNANIDITKIARKIVGDSYGIQTNIAKQSSEIYNGVRDGGAGDQGIMVGYACRDNIAMIPQELYLARSMCQFIYEKHREDGKVQITIDDEKKINVIVASFANVSSETLRSLVIDWLALSPGYEQHKIDLHINPAGEWKISGFEADTGLTGRKLAIDNYGPQIPIGGGAFSGKDATKVDRSGAYMARKMAVDYLRDNDVNEVFVKLAYSIGVASPVMVSIVADGEVKEYLPEKYNYDLTPLGIIGFLDLRKPQFVETAEWGHFGNNFIWDK